MQSNASMQALIQAVRDDEPETVTRLLQGGDDINEFDDVSGAASVSESESAIDTGFAANSW